MAVHGLLEILPWVGNNLTKIFTWMEHSRANVKICKNLQIMNKQQYVINYLNSNVQKRIEFVL